MFESKTFVNGVVEAIGNGSASLDYLVDAYNWANVHIKEIKKSSPDYEQRWLQDQIKRVFNVDPQVYTRVAVHLGGGRDARRFKNGRSLIRRFGYYESFRADRLLSQQQMKQLGVSASKMNVDEFRSMVEELAEVKQAKADVSVPDRIDYKREYFRLLQENAALRKEIQLLRRWQRKFEEKLGKE